MCSAVAVRRGHVGYMIPFEHMSVPVRALRLGTRCVFVQELDLQNSFFSVIQLPGHGSMNRYEGAVCKQPEAQSGDPAKR